MKTLCMHASMSSKSVDGVVELILEGSGLATQWQVLVDVW